MRTSLLAIGVLLALGTNPATAQSPVELGRLTCKSADTKNLVLVTKQKFDCSFKQLDGVEEQYVGEIKKVGVDLSVKNDIVIVWMVSMLANAEKPHSIAGTYVGVSADASVGAGGGGRVLVGRGDNAISLSPSSVTGVKGVGVSLGVERFVLSPGS